MRKCVIIGGGEITAYAEIKKSICENDYIICCDSGYLHAKAVGLAPSLIVGDFDSMPRPETTVETIVLPCEKDDTDSFFAAKEGLKRGFTDFLLLGMTGGRLDHTLGAVSILEYLDAAGAAAQIVDDTTRIRVTRKTLDIDKNCRYFSVFAVGRAEGVSIKNAKYCLDNAIIESTFQYGVSNEPKGTPRVSVKQGKLLIMEIYK